MLALAKHNAVQRLILIISHSLLEVKIPDVLLNFNKIVFIRYVQDFATVIYYKGDVSLISLI